jgi:hypothetical protein
LLTKNTKIQQTTPKKPTPPKRVRRKKREMESKLIFKSPYEHVEIPEVPIFSFVFSKLAEHGDNVVLVDGPTGRHYTLKQVTGATKKVLFFQFPFFFLNLRCLYLFSLFSFYFFLFEKLK